MKTMINLLPASYRRQLLARRRAIQWGSILCTVLVSGWVWHWYERREGVLLSQQLESLKREQAPTQTMLQQLVAMRQTLADLEQQEAVVKELEYQRNALTLLGVISSTARSTNGRLRVTKLELTNFQNTQPPAAATARSAPSSGLLLSGVSLDNPAVAELLDGLQDSGIFRRVELLTLREREEGTLSLRDYEVRCEF